jgi:two-component system, OmpR family, KDP operon response regulator KdpE
MTAVLIADPDARTRRVTAAALRFAGYTVETTSTSARVAALLRRRQLDALVLDPADTGPVETVSALRAQTDIPIIVVSATAAEWDKVAVLDAGADDYLSKPFGVEELQARLRVALRRGPITEAADPAVTTPDFTIHLRDRRWIRCDQTEVRLTPIEWQLVEMLVRRAGHLVTQAELLQAIWGPNAKEKTHYLRVYLTGIRHKVEPEPSRPRYFITAPGLGLRFDPYAGDRLQPC